jgi:ABC-type lipoprotein release transport system permease subunit
MVVKEGMAMAIIGCAAGLLAAGRLTWKLESLLYGVAPTEPQSFAGVTLLTLAIALLASYVPARRIADMNPVTALYHAFD